MPCQLAVVAGCIDIDTLADRLSLLAVQLTQHLCRVGSNTILDMRFALTHIHTTQVRVQQQEKSPTRAATDVYRERTNETVRILPYAQEHTILFA